jgi:galactokinase
MDQTIVATGRAGHAMLLDCRSLEKTFVPLDGNDVRVVIVNSMVKHELTGGEYAQRRGQCEEGVEFFKTVDPSIRALRDVSLQLVESAKNALPEVVYRRCRHVVTENARTTQAAKLLAGRHYRDIGTLMVQSHASLRDDYEVSIEELDFLAAEAMKVSGVYGARMTGGGFGGCIVALVGPPSVQSLIGHLTSTYSARFAKTPAAYVTTATAGAAVIP